MVRRKWVKNELFDWDEATYICAALLKMDMVIYLISSSFTCFSFNFVLVVSLQDVERLEADSETRRLGSQANGLARFVSRNRLHNTIFFGIWSDASEADFNPYKILTASGLNLSLEPEHRNKSPNHPRSYIRFNLFFVQPENQFVSSRRRIESLQLPGPPLLCAPASISVSDR
jgi:hypothetical protein